ncbi:MAG: glycosyltransferase [Gemmatimonadota bacterium]
MSSLPFLSIIIPTYSRPDQLATCLRALADQRYPCDRFEVIVVDDGSPSPLNPVVDAFRAHIELTLLRQSNAGPSLARNTGAARARGALLAFTDDDCVPDPGWLSALAGTFRSYPEALLGGQTIGVLTTNPYATASQLLVSYVYAYYNRDPDEARFFASNNMAVPARLFLEIGGFNTVQTRAAAEDRELCDHWISLGYRLRYVPDAVIRHAHALTPGGFWRQHFNYGRGAVEFRRARSGRGVPPLPIEPLSFYADMLRFPFAEQSGFRALRHSALIGFSQLASTVGFFWEAVGRRLRP